MAKKDAHWMEEAFSRNHGALHRETGTAPGHKISQKALTKAEHSSNPTERKRANLAETARKINRKG